MRQTGGVCVSSGTARRKTQDGAILIQTVKRKEIDRMAHTKEIGCPWRRNRLRSPVVDYKYDRCQRPPLSMQITTIRFQIWRSSPWRSETSIRVSIIPIRRIRIRRHANRRRHPVFTGDPRPRNRTRVLLVGRIEISLFNVPSTSSLAGEATNDNRGDILRENRWRILLKNFQDSGYSRLEVRTK